MQIKPIVLLAIFFSLVVSLRAELTPVELRCDYAVNPLGVDSAPTKLFWKLESGQRDQTQSAYQILAASSEKNLAHDHGDLWDSGKVASDESIQINYAGTALESWQKVFWKVRVWDANGKVSRWSRPAHWTMGVLRAEDWHAEWIGSLETNIPSLLLRREFYVKAGLKRALVNICGLGQYELTLNGKKAGDEFLSPGWTKYNKTCLYDTFDITEMLRTGKNAAGVELGNGMYRVFGGERFTKFKGSFGPQKVIAQIRLEYFDGSVEFVGTDGFWHTAAGPVTFNSIYGGESYDARLAQADWDKPGFDDKNWRPAVLLQGTGGKLRGLSCAAPPVKFFESHEPVSSKTLTNGDVVFDLGQNASHDFKISVTGPAGSNVRLIPSELIDAQGAANQSSMGAGHRGTIWCDFTKGSDGTETWSPKFFYIGCRYVQVHLTPAKPGESLPKLKKIEGIVIHSASESAGEFECSNDLFNRVFSLVRWAQQNNMVSLLTDCPHRERLGWLEEDHLNGPALRYDFSLPRLFTKILNDIADSQLTNGLVPTTAPEYTVFHSATDSQHLRNDFGDSPEWSATLILAPWQQYEFDGDLNLFRLHYAVMTNYLAYLETRATNHILSFGLGDWYDLGPKKPGYSQLTPIPLTATAFYYEDAQIMSQAAGLLGKTEDQKYFAGLAENIRQAFNEKFYDSTNQCYATNSQCADAIPLVFGICETSNRQAVLDSLVRDVQSHGNSLTAGDVGYRYLLRALADGGRNDIIFEMNNRTNKPGYGMQLAKGKTSLTEAWDGGSSQDHFMLGQIQEWFYHDLAGIQNATNSAGFHHINLAPHPVGDMTSAKASYDSIRGKITSEWQRQGGKFVLKISIPANTSATVCVPSKHPETVRIIPANGKNTKSRTVETDCAIFEVGSGAYEFRGND